MRNNINTNIRIPQFANLSLYATGYHLTVTFPIKDSTIPFIKFIPNNNWDIDIFYWKNRHYISARKDFTYPKLTESNGDLQEVIWNYAGRMCNNLRIIIKEAKIRELNNEINHLTLDF